MPGMPSEATATRRAILSGRMLPNDSHTTAHRLVKNISQQTRMTTGGSEIPSFAAFSAAYRSQTIAKSTMNLHHEYSRLDVSSALYA